MKTKIGKEYWNEIQKLRNSKDFCQCKQCKPEREKAMIKTLELSFDYLEKMEKIMFEHSGQAFMEILKEYDNKRNHSSKK